MITVEARTGSVLRGEAGKLDWQAHGRDLAKRRMRIGGEHPARFELRSVEGSLHRTDGRDGDATTQQLDPVVGRLLGQASLEDC